MTGLDLAVKVLGLWAVVSVLGLLCWVVFVECAVQVRRWRVERRARRRGGWLYGTGRKL